MIMISITGNNRKNGYINTPLIKHSNCLCDGIRKHRQNMNEKVEYYSWEHANKSFFAVRLHIAPVVEYINKSM